MNARFSVERFTAAELLPAVSASGAGWYVAQDVRRAAALQLPRNGGGQQLFRGLSIHPRSQIRALSVWLDDEGWSRTLVAGQVLRCSFRQVRVEPLDDAPRALGNVSGFVQAQTGAPAPRSAQLGAVVLWVDDPGPLNLPVGNRVQIVQDLSAVNLNPQPQTVAHVLTGGAISAVVAVTNRGTACAGALDHVVFQADAAVSGYQSPIGSAPQFSTAAGTLTLPATGSQSLVALTITNPAASIIVNQTAPTPSTATGAWRCSIVISLLYPQGAP